MADLPTWILVAETKEFVGPITVLADGAPGTFEVAVTAPGARPASFAAADQIGTDFGVLVGAGTTIPLTAGVKYTVWTKFTDDPEIPVDKVGYIKAV